MQNDRKRPTMDIRKIPDDVFQIDRNYQVWWNDPQKLLAFLLTSKISFFPTLK